VPGDYLTTDFLLSDN